MKTPIKTTNLWVLLATLALLSGCKPRYAREMIQLEGRWNIVEATVTTILADGSTVVEEHEDAGYLEISPDPLDIGNDSGTKEVVFVYDDGNVQVSYAGLLTNDDNNQRLWMVRYFCSDLFNCDLGINIDEDRGRTQVWSSYFNGSAGRNQYFPASNDVHVKWTWKLRKEGL